MLRNYRNYLIYHIHKVYQRMNLTNKNTMRGNKNTQTSPGHFWTLQFSSSELGPSQSLPPWFAETFWVRVFVLVPPPQVFVHVPGIQSFHSQLTTQ